VQLLKDAEGTTTVTRDLYIDMNGRNATIQAAENVTIYGFDSQTDDYTVSDGKYGKLTVTGGNVQVSLIESDKPVIRMALVELDGAPFKFFAANREKWAVETCYVYPGAIQYWGPSEVCDQTIITLALEQSK